MFLQNVSQVLECCHNANLDILNSPQSAFGALNTIKANLDLIYDCANSKEFIFNLQNYHVSSEGRNDLIEVILNFILIPSVRKNRRLKKWANSEKKISKFWI